MNCAFCENPENKKRLIIKNDYAWAFPTNLPIVPGHILICPTRCVARFEDLTEKERKAIFELILKLKPALIKVFDAEGFNFAWNEGDVAGQSIPHFHLHMLPRKKGDSGITEYEPRKFLYRPGSREKTPQEEIIKVSESIRKEL